MLSKKDKVERAVYSLVMTMRDQIKSTITNDIDEKRLLVTPHESEKLSLIIDNTIDGIFHRGVEEVVTVACASEENVAKSNVKAHAPAEKKGKKLFDKVSRK